MVFKNYFKIYFKFFFIIHSKKCFLYEKKKNSNNITKSTKKMFKDYNLHN